MEKSSRRRIFYLLIAAFIIIAPLLIAYSLGYTFNIPQRKVEQVGGIFIKSRIARLSVFLDNQFIKETSIFSGGTLLDGVEPGTHLLRLEKTGYSPLTKAVKVEPTLVTELRNILLVSEKIIPATTTPEETLKIARLRSAETSPPNSGATTSLGLVSLDPKGSLVAAAGTTTQVLASNVHSFVYAGDKIYLVDKNGFVANYILSENRTEILGRPGFFLDERPLRFILIPGGNFAVLDGAGGLYLFNPRGEVIKTVAGNIKKVLLDGQGAKALLLKEFELGVLWLKDNPYQPFQKLGEFEVIMTLKSPLLDARWLFLDNAHIILKTEEGIFMTELDGRGGRYTAELWPEATDEIFTSPELPNSAFFRKGETWFEIEF